MADELTDKEYTRLRQEFPFSKGCPTCGGEKTYSLDGKVHECDCRTQAALQRTYYQANIPRRYHMLSMNDFEDEYRRENQHAVDAVDAFIENFDMALYHGLGLVFQGPQGTGKTLLATHVLKEVVKRGYTGFFMQFTDVINVWGSSWKDADSKLMLERNLKQRQLVVLDDIVTDGRNREGFLANGLEEVFRHRQNNQLPTLMTTNLKEREFAQEFPRSLSLVLGSAQWLEIHGRDYRPTNLKTITELVKTREKLPIK